MIRLENANKIYRTGQENVQALANIDLTVERGRFLTIMGPSGSGKSTLLSLIGLLSEPTGGRLLIEGRDVGRLPDREKTALRRQKFGFVFQFPSLVGTLTVRENVLLPKWLAGRVTQADGERAEQLLEQVGLAGKGDHRAHQLSGGEQRRAALARALIHDPEVVLADEPTGALDKQTAQTIMKMFQALRCQGKTVLVVTHDPEWSLYGDRVILLYRGRIAYDGGTIANRTGKTTD